LEQLSYRGHFSLSVNNKAGHTQYRPQAFVYSDDSFKFSHSIWYDPAIMKFCPLPKWNGYRAKLKRKDPSTGKFYPAGTVLDCPNVWAFSRRSWMESDDSFFTEPTAAWGNHQEGVERTGNEKTVCTMLIAIRLLYYLGARTIFLVGVDFDMQPGREYSFNQDKESEGASDSNNRQYRIVNDLLTEMQVGGTFDKFGLTIYNCNPNSGLQAFSYKSFEQCLDASRGYVEKIPSLSHWYEKIEEHRMERIEKLVSGGNSMEQILNSLNQGVTKKGKEMSVESLDTYLRVLYERQSR